MNWMKRSFAAATLMVAGATAPALAQEGRGDVVYVPTPQVVVEEMLRMAKVGPKDFLIDLGSGDGRIVITAVKQFGAQGFGVDLDTYLINVARKVAQTEGVESRARFIEQNLFETDLSKATVISSYLLPEMNLKLRPKLLQLKPGTRIVAHDYHMGAWFPDEEKDIPVPEKVVGTPGVSYVYLWFVPARVAGAWQVEVAGGAKPETFDVAFEQIFQMVEGSLRAGGQNTLVRGRLTGEEIVFTTQPKTSPGGQRHEFRGRVQGEKMSGTVRIGDGAAARQASWTAQLKTPGKLRRAADELEQ
jgi:methylase of polypeptide subunit release factors